MGSNQYVNLHGHAEFSALDGLARVSEYVRSAYHMDMPALALTDHGSLSGLPELYRECKEVGIGAVLGSELYYTPKFSDAKENKYTLSDLMHITVLARGEKGYRVLTELSTETYKNFYRKPLADRALLRSLGKDAEHLTILTGCLGAPVNKAAQIGRQALEEELDWWRKVFPHLYVELQDHEIDIDYSTNKNLLWAAKKFDIPFVTTLDCHYCKQADAANHDALLAIQTGKDINDPERFRFNGSGYWLKSPKEMQQSFTAYPEWVWERASRTSIELAKECVGKIPEWETKTWHVPAIPGIEKPFKEVIKIVQDELRSRNLSAKYIKRAKQELEVIRRLKVSGFLLIARDCIQWARSQGIVVGSSRGSVSGSLVAQLLGIHNCDPLKYDLRFDRFLNQDRPSMPDIDTDFQASRRDELFAYVREKYGEDNVVGVATFMKMKVKKAFKALAKSHGISFIDANKISQDLIDEDEDLEDHIPQVIKDRYPDLLTELEALTGIKCGYGSHPAGVVIASPEFKLKEKIPQMYLPSSKRWTAQYDMDAFSEIGLMKQDFLGLRTLDTVAEVVKTTQIKEDPFEWVPDEMPWDAEVYKMLSEGKTGGIFQLEGKAATAGIVNFGVTCFQDIVHILSLFRAGPMESGMVDLYLKNRKNVDSIEYLHPDLEPILEETYGAIIFQEQVLAIGEKVALLDSGTNYDLLKAVTKKKREVMLEIRPVFIEGCISNGMVKATATQLWDQIETNASYCFNKSHACGYGLLTYLTSCLKHLYPLDFYTALLHTVDDPDKRLKYMKEVIQSGYEIKRPDINRSGVRARPDYESKAILFGLSEIKGVGKKAANAIIEYRKEPFWTISQVADIVNNSRVMQALEDAGAFNEIGGAHDPDKEQDLLGWSFRDTMKPYRNRFKKLHRPPHSLVGEITSITKGTTKAKKPYVTWNIKWAPAEDYNVRLWSELKSLFEVPKGTIVRAKGRWEESWKNMSCNDLSDVTILENFDDR